MGQLVSSDRIHAWHDALALGGGVRSEGTSYEQAVLLAVVRWMNGLGPDTTDPENGKRAFANVTLVLDA